MPKEKKRLIDETNEKATLFYYEIIGTVILLLSFVSLGKLGKVGSILTTIFKILFGDWYFLFIIYLLFLGVYYLFIHEPFNYKGHRFIGFIFLSIIIILFSHFSIHNYIISTGENYISSTFSIYKNYINTGVSNNLGGGMIGALLFYIINLLMGNIGVILIGIFLAVLSLSLIFKTPFFDIFKWGFKRIKGTGSLFLHRPKKDGYAMLGWSTTPDGKNMVANIDGSCDLYPVYVTGDFSINIVCENGSGWHQRSVCRRFWYRKIRFSWYYDSPFYIEHFMFGISVP